MFLVANKTPSSVLRNFDDSHSCARQRISERIEISDAISVISKNELELSSGLHSGGEHKRAFVVLEDLGTSFQIEQTPLSPVAVHQIVGARRTFGEEIEIGVDEIIAGVIHL